MTRFPLNYAHGNLLFGPGGECAALYRLGMVSYPFRTVSGKWELQRRLERLAHTVGADFSLWRVCRAYPARSYLRDTLGLLDSRGQDREVWEAFLTGHRDQLAGMRSHVAETYLAVSLDERAPAGFGSGLIRLTDRVRARVEGVAGTGKHAAIPAARIRELRGSEERVFERLQGVVSLRRARTVDIQWLLSRVATRGVAEARVDRYWKPQALVVDAPDGHAAFEPLGEVVSRQANAAITEHERSLTVEGDVRCFQALLALGALGDAPEFPGAGAELLFAPLESIEFPVDAVMHARWLGNRDALAQVRKRIADVEHAYAEQVQGAAFGPGLQAEEDRTLAREYEAQLQAGSRPPMLTGWIGLALGAPTPEELESRVSILREHFGDVQLHRPAGLQHQLFFDHVLRADGGVTLDYAQQVTVEQFGALVPTATRTVGSPHGPYLGYTPTGLPRPVRYDPTQASRESRASAVLLVGTLGSGKTVAAQTIAYAAERRGSLIVDFDPKPDHGWENLPELHGRLEVLELSGEQSQQGKLDPLAIGPADLREEIASSYLLELLRDPPAAWENAISRAVRDAVREGSRGLMRVVERLKESEQDAARDAGEALEVVSDFGLARLGFGTGQDTTVQARGSVVTIRMPGLSLPDPAAARDTYTRTERVSVATLTLVAAYVLRLVSQDRTRHKVVLLDEAWFLLASPRGRVIVDRLTRLGRAFNTTLLLGTQRTADLDGLSELIGVYFIFGQDSDTEAARALGLIGLDPGDQGLVNLICGFRQGRCLMRDLDGRVGEVQIDPVYQHLLEAFDTTPAQADGSGA
ncbi:MAG: ATP-binding protein [Solirubrobacteraceae bacterium]